MTGKFNKAPLVYASAHISTTPIPLTIDQKTMLAQAMVKCGLPVSLSAEIEAIEFGNDQNTTSPKLKDLEFNGYFSVDRTESVVFGNDYIEWRTSNYTTYAEMADRISSILDLIIDKIDFINDALTRELTIKYCDLIIPIKDRTIEDYFEEKSILPLFQGIQIDSDIDCMGKTDVTRIVKKKLRMSMLLEQLRLNEEGAPTKSISDMMVEPIPKFGMPIKNKHETNREKSGYYYAILGTSASKLLEEKFSELDKKTLFSDLHSVIGEFFRSIINSDVCNEDWEYTEEV